MTRDEAMKLEPNKTSIVNVEHPEWGGFGVRENNAQWLVVSNGRGNTVVHYGEAKFWRVA